MEPVTKGQNDQRPNISPKLLVFDRVGSHRNSLFLELPGVEPKKYSRCVGKRSTRATNPAMNSTDFMSVKHADAMRPHHCDGELNRRGYERPCGNNCRYAHGSIGLYTSRCSHRGLLYRHPSIASRWQVVHCTTETSPEHARTLQSKLPRKHHSFTSTMLHMYTTYLHDPRLSFCTILLKRVIIAGGNMSRVERPVNILGQSSGIKAVIHGVQLNRK